MGRGQKPAKSKEAKPPVARKAPKDDGARVRDLEKRLAEALKRESEALERETATSGILRVISNSPTDTQPVLDAVAESAARLCSAYDAVIFRLDGDVLRRAAHTGSIPAPPGFAIPATRSRVTGRAVLDRQPVHVTDAQAKSEEFPETRTFALEHGFRTILSVPLLREGLAIGTIDLRRTELQPFTETQIALLKTFADQAVIAIENARLFKELQSSNRELSTTLDTQTATSEILRVISQSPTEVQPVFEAIVASAVKLCDGLFGTLWQFDGELIHQVAQHNYTPEALEEMRRVYPCRPSRAHGSARAILERAVVHIPDVEVDPEFRLQALSRAVGWRSGLFVPMLRDGAPIGVIAVSRARPGPFADNEIELLRTFADQAVIAIENVRLFKELETRNRDLTAALDQQTATSEILRVISSSPTDVQPVFDAIVRSAGQLCEADFGGLHLLDAGHITLEAHYNAMPGEYEVWKSVFPTPVGRHSASGRAILDRVPVQINDVRADPDYGFSNITALDRHRTLLAVPMLREGEPIGTISVWRGAVRPFTDKQIALLQTFADQAVIAIENVRLFTELQQKNEALTQAHTQVSEALEQQTATSDILQVISSSPTDVQPVFDAIAQSAMRLCEGTQCLVTRFDGELLHVAASAHLDPAAVEQIQQRFPIRPMRASMHGRTILEGGVVHIPDVRADAEYDQSFSRIGLHRSALVVPMLREGRPVGTIGVARGQVRPFTDKQIALLKTFADQAVIAIENVRLFTETKEALERQTATAEILRVIASSPTDLQPVLDAVAERAARLCGANDAVIFSVDGDVRRQVAHFGSIPVAQPSEVRVGRGPVTGRAIRERRTVHVRDVLEEIAREEYEPFLQRDISFRTILATPLLREDMVIGAIVIRRTEVRPFTDTQISLLQTFADQAVIAIENVRLFNELAEKNQALTDAHANTSEALERQTATAEILRVISSSPTAVQPVLDAVVESAVRLCGAYDARLWQLEGDQLVRAAAAGPFLEESAAWLPLDPKLPSPRAFLERRTIHFDVPAIVATHPEGFPALQRLGLKSGLATPLLREGKPIGVLAVRRQEAMRFSDKHVELLQTFADQAVIAIENVRLFKELETRNRDLTESLEQQTATSEILRVISSSPTDTQPVFDVIARSAATLCNALFASVNRFDGELLNHVADYNLPPETLKLVSQNYPKRPDRTGTGSRAVLTRAVVHIADILQDAEYQRDLAVTGGWRGMLSVPMLRGVDPIGSITIAKAEPSLFTDSQVALLKTFADQAVIAIENVRLFTELQARTQQLTRSVEQLTALREVGHAVSSSLDLETVLNTIVARAVQLAGAHSGTIWEYDAAADEFVLRITQNVEDPELRANPNARVRRGEGAVGRLAISRRPVQIPDITHEGAYEGRLRDSLVGAGTRALLAIPLLHEDQLLGGLVISRRTPGEYPAEVVDLLASFATQSALALQNARLFLEIEDKSRQLQAASQHKSEFLANMSHELRTPLNAIIGFSEVLTERMFGELNEKQEEYLKDIYASGTHLLSLINDILDLSKIEAGRMELELTDFHLPTAIDNALILVRERAGRRGIALEHVVDEHLGEMRGDERKIKQVLLNLLSNALKFTPEGGRVNVRAAMIDGMAEVSVTDTGVGIAPEDQGAIFEEFRQVGTAEKKAEGTGLGLTLCRKFVELHGGRIWVTSQVGVGSTFTFRLPVRCGE